MAVHRGSGSRPRTPAGTMVGGAGLSLVILVGACGSDYPSRDWSGSYLARMIGSSSDCVDSPLPPPLTAFQLRVTQAPNNAAAVWMNPIVTLNGAFEGDRLVVEAMFREEVQLPDSLRARITPADSFDMIVYHLEAEFEDRGFRGSYEIHAPDMRALAQKSSELRCSYRYELTGTRFEPPALQAQPWMREVAPVGPAAPTTVPSDSAAAADVIGAPAESS